MDLTTTYMGLRLRTPLVVAASPLSDELDNIKRMEDAGASAVVLRSLFEEQLLFDNLEMFQGLEQGTHSSPEALSYFPEPVHCHFGPHEYLEHIARAKEAVRIPIIASLNGSSPGGWTNYSRQMQQAGADGIELNIYTIPTDLDLPGSEVEQTFLDVLEAVKREVKIPVAMKLSPFFSNFANMAKRLDDLGADALVLFNRFYQPDIDLEALEVRPNILLSTPMAMRLPLRWIAILYSRLRANLAATSGIHRASDALKMLLVGADVTMLCSVIMRHGIEQITSIEKEMLDWMDAHEYASILQLRGSMSQMNCPDPAAFERAQYMRALSNYSLKPH